jgi:glycerol kinase|tara:strand:+ start:2236 stop:3693 length:1458 start_codon:yes stop_codon:yes gene_type:complete
MNKYFLSIDQGTTSSRAVLYDDRINQIDFIQKELSQYFPSPGYVEHDAKEIWDSVIYCIKELLLKNNLSHKDIISIGITNQRETVVAWDKKTGIPVHKALVWQDRRTFEYCARLKGDGLEPEINKKTGLLLDPYFSASKLNWLINNLDKTNFSNILFGTIDCYLIWKLTEGRKYCTDITNASRTSLFNINTFEWDQELLKIFDINNIDLPEVKENADDYGETLLFGGSIKISGVAGDQQSALIGQNGFESGAIKSTYGTGCFLILNTAEELIRSKNKLLTTIGFKLNSKVSYALEGSIFMAGSTIQWLRDQMGILDSSEESEKKALNADLNSEVCLIPAMTGLGAPHWSPEAKGAIFGLTMNSTSNEICLAALEAVAFQTRELVSAMKADGGKLSSLKIDGGMSKNNFFSQILANTLDIRICRPTNIETTALGAAYLAALGSGYATQEEIVNFWKMEKEFEPQENLDKKFGIWQKYLESLIKQKI